MDHEEKHGSGRTCAPANTRVDVDRPWRIDNHRRWMRDPVSRARWPPASSVICDAIRMVHDATVLAQATVRKGLRLADPVCKGPPEAGAGDSLRRVRQGRRQDGGKHKTARADPGPGRLPNSSCEPRAWR